MQILGALIVIAGVCTAAFPSKEGAGIFAEVVFPRIHDLGDHMRDLQQCRCSYA